MLHLWFEIHVDKIELWGMYARGCKKEGTSARQATFRTWEMAYRMFPTVPIVHVEWLK